MSKSMTQKEFIKEHKEYGDIELNEQENQNAESDGNIIDLTPCGSKKIEEIHCKMYKSGDFTQ